MASDWSRAEVESTVADYFAMLTKELAGEPLNKAAHNRNLQRFLDNRSTGAIEFKHANISAILIELGYPCIDGYKPRGNYQELLREVVTERIENEQSLQNILGITVVAPVASVPEVGELSKVIVAAPRRELQQGEISKKCTTSFVPKSGVNYLEHEARNVSLGLAGEKFVLRVEYTRLLNEGARHLANRMEHVAKTQGDSLGYDILSYESDGRERLIEVKTTRFGAMTPFFVTQNEVNVSNTFTGKYYLYRLFKFEKDPKLFILPGSLEQSAALSPVLYRASIP